MYKDVRMSKEQETDLDNREFDEDYIPIDKPIDNNIHIFGYNISDLPKNMKLLFGFSFLSVIMGIIYFLVYYLRKMKYHQNGKLKKKKN